MASLRMVLDYWCLDQVWWLAVTTDWLTTHGNKTVLLAVDHVKSALREHEANLTYTRWDHFTRLVQLS
jgi:hypothetical protein